jgi:hypothetical protein
MVKVLHLVDKSIEGPLRIVLQTNGVALQTVGILTELANLARTKNLRILIELSFKGTNSEEFSLLTQKKPDLFLRQIGAYNALQKLASVSVRARLGIGPHHKSIMFVYPDTFPEQNRDQSIEPMFHPSKWSEMFKAVYEKELRKHGYFAIESINVTEGGINTRTQLNIPAISRLLERRLVVDRANRINTYRDFSRISKARFPLLDFSQTERLEKQYQDIKSRFGIVSAAAYLTKNEFPL